MNTDLSLKQRIKELLHSKGVTINSFAKTAGVSQATINGQINGDIKISASLIYLVLETYPDISAEWLLRGEGSMLRTDAGTDIVLNNSNSHHNNIGSGNLTHTINSDTDMWKKIIADKDEQIAELKKDKELLGNLLQTLTRR